MRKRALLIFLVVVIAVLGLARANVLQTEVSSPHSGRARVEVVEPRSGSTRDRGGQAGSSGLREREPQHAENDAASQRTGSPPSSASPDAPAPATARAPKRAYADHDAEPAPPLGPGLRDRTGTHDALAQALRTEFEPLAAECLDQASERAPQLEGTLAMGFEIVPDPESGSIVASVDPLENNEIADAELIECIRQTMLSASLPATDEAERLMITIDVGGP